MGKRKSFIKTDLTTPVIGYIRDSAGAAMVPPDVIPPAETEVEFHRGVGGGSKRFDFRRWYGAGIDSVAYSCQRQIERFLDGQDKELTDLTIRTLCQSGLAGFLDYLMQLAIALNRDLTLTDICRETIDGYLMALRDTGISRRAQKDQYSNTKSVLKALCSRGVIQEVRTGDAATFPRNPFPGVHKGIKGERPLPKAQRQAFVAAIRAATMPLFSDNIAPTSELLAYALLCIALHTGRNTWPLLELGRDCLHPHPRDGMLFLVLYKRRGHSTNKVPLRAEDDSDLSIGSMPTVRPSVARLIRRVLQLTEPLLDGAPEHARNRLWLYQMRSPGGGVGYTGMITALTTSTLERAIKLLVKRYALVDTDGSPLRLNVSRLRKTFVNRIYEILDGDIVSTAVAAGDSVAITDVHYLRPGELARKNWKFMGIALVTELLTATIGATERTPMGRCSDPVHGEHAPKRDGTICMSFLNCIRCRNYVVTGDDLYRVFSFYWRIMSERTRMPKKQWHRQFNHIVRLIDRDVIDAGLAKGVFEKDLVERERERARHSPHTFWQSETIISELAGTNV
ncbi:hypothetical protein E9536_25910 [Burkholderia sp. LS-044]|uniref:hypothetical protein n=1 Tax=Burkholderia sp. LS-044 TaxID=1459967 RepID=UPI0010A5CF41|nr:hypothetical protein [Burkholderia sp. LS-044]THJ50831.1 hypothetical protein E9536_25910 [Burkholderia sp. LS-044]